MTPDFTLKLLEWNEMVNRRAMPWKGERDPYRIWLSEVILQQTRVEQGWSYYERFISRFPDVDSLAAAPAEEVFKCWEGLGYYTRCRNLIQTAQYISRQCEGRFPRTYDEILALKGIGPYTAAAIASFAFDEKRAVVDGNVQRVLARYFGITTAIDSPEGKKVFSLMAASLIDEYKPAIYNQAIMDFGATVCKPKQPLCLECPQAPDCEAFRHGQVDKLPVKAKAAARRTRWLYYFVIEAGDGVYIRQRSAKDIWQNLHEFVLFEAAAPSADPASEFLQDVLHPPYTVLNTGPVITQQLTHQRIEGRFILVRAEGAVRLSDEYRLISRSEIQKYAFPKFIKSYLEKLA